MWNIASSDPDELEDVLTTVVPGYQPIHFECIALYPIVSKQTVITDLEDGCARHFERHAVWLGAHKPFVATFDTPSRGNPTAVLGLKRLDHVKLKVLHERLKGLYPLLELRA
jgi:hypothetical protein